MSGVRVSPDGRLLLTSGAGTATLWEIATGRQLRQFRVPQTWGVFAHVEASFSPTGRYVTLAFSNDLGLELFWPRPHPQEFVALVESASGQVIYHSRPHDEVTAFAISPDEHSFVIGRKNWAPGLTHLITQTLGACALAPGGTATSALAQHLAAFGVMNSNVLATWVLVDVDVTTATEAPAVVAHPKEVMAVSFLPGGKRLLTRGYDGSAWLWIARPLKKLRQTDDRTRWPDNTHLASLTRVFSADGKWVVGVRAGKARRWRADNGGGEVTFESPEGTVDSVAISSDGCRALTGGEDGTARLWDATAGAQLKHLKGTDGAVRAVAFLPQGMALTETHGPRYFEDGNDSLVRWDLSTGREVERYRRTPVDVLAVALSTDGRHALTGTDEREAVLWDATAGRELLRLGPHHSPVSGVGFLPDGRRLATSGDRDRIRFWDRETGKELASLAVRGESSFTAVRKFAIAPDGKHLLVLGEDPELWGLASRKKERTFQGLPHYVDRDNAAATKKLQNTRSRSFPENLGISGDGKLVLGSGEEGTVIVWDAASGRPIRRLPDAGRQFGKTVALSPDGKSILALRKDGRLALWDVTTGREERALGEEHAGVDVVSFSPDGRKAIGGDGFGRLRLWDVATSREEWAIEKAHRGRVQAVAFSTDGRTLLTGGSDGKACLWEAATGKLQRRLAHLSATAIRATYALGDGSCALEDFSDNIFLFPAFGATLPRKIGLRIEGTQVTQVDFSANARFLALVRSLEQEGGHVRSMANPFSNEVIELWDLVKPRLIGRLEGPNNSIVLSASFIPGTRAVMTAGVDGWLRTWGPTTRHRGVHSVRLGEPGDILAISADGGRALQFRVGVSAMRLIETNTGKVLAEIRDFPQKIDETTMPSWGGRWVLWPDSRDSVQLFDVSLAKAAGRFKHKRLGSAALSPDGSQVLTGGADNVARLWDRRSGEMLREFPGRARPSLGPEDDKTPDISAVEFSPDGTRVALVSVGETCVATIYSLSGQEIKSFPAPPDVYWTAIKFSPDRKALATASLLDPSVQVWDLQTGEQWCTLRGQAAAGSMALTYSSDGRYLLRATEDGTTTIWETGVGMKGKEVCSLFGSTDGGWTVIAPDGRFDASNPDSIPGLSWVFRDDPFHALPPEIFLRDYYEPNLFARLMAREEFQEVRSLAELNRVQPEVKIVDVKPAPEADRALVSVEIVQGRRSFPRGGKWVDVKSEVHDLRLFRDGQLVAQWPSPPPPDVPEPSALTAAGLEAWRQATRINLDPATGTQRVCFSVRLPRGAAVRQVEFSAYAFNCDRVKSATDRKTWVLPARRPARGRAYLITMGVTTTDSPYAWQLHFPGDDARRVRDALKGALERTGVYEVIPLRLVSNPEKGEVALSPTRMNLRAVLGLLAGRAPPPTWWDALPNEVRKWVRGALKPARPDDLVFLALSCHGVAADGEFYLVPADIGSDATEEPTQRLLSRCLSSRELARWLREVDAGQMALVIDACHADAAVEAGGFKPAPLGGRGLGQVAYDKRMRVLTATQAENTTDDLLGGLLSKALAEGLSPGRIPHDGRLTLSGLFDFAAMRAPELYRENIEKRLAGDDSGPVPQPSLFDFAGGRPDPVLVVGR
jgi:WD40 repeat protein